MKHILLTVSALLCFGGSYGQPMTTTLGVEATDLADRLQGEGVIILNPELHCHWVKQGLYEDEADILGIGDGIVLSSGNLLGLIDDNTEFPVNPISTPGPSYAPLIDTLYHFPLLESWGIECLGPWASCALTMDVVPQYHLLAFDYVLADGLLDSILPEPEDPYSQPVNWIAPPGLSAMPHPCICYPYTDFITAMISGGSLEDTVNLAVYPEDNRGPGGDPVNRYTLRMTEEMFGDMCDYEDGADGLFWDGPYPDYCRYNQEGGSIEEPGLRVRGMTIPMQASVSLDPCDTYRLVLSASMLWSDGLSGANLGRAVYFISNLHSSGDSCGAMGIEDMKYTLDLSIAPNPFEDQLVLVAGNGFQAQQLWVDLSDMTGRILLSAEGNLDEVNHYLQQSVPSLNTGIYFLKVRNETGREQHFKVVRQR